MKKRTLLTKKTIIGVIFVIFVLANVLPVILASAFSTIISDDFSHFTLSGIDSNTDIFHFFCACLEEIGHFYKTWGGVFFAIFINIFFSPVGYFKGQTYSLFMVFNAVFTCASFLYLMLVYWRYVTREKTYHDWLPLFMAACGIYMLVNYDVHSEIFFWFTGATAYSIPLSCVFLSVVFYIRYKQCRRTICMFLSCLIGFLAMGGSSSVSGTGCFLCLLFCVYESLKDKHIEKSGICLFVIMLLGAVINVAAPGNYVRQSHMDTAGLHPVSALLYAIIEVVKRIQWLNHDTGFVSILVLILALGIYIGKEQKFSITYGITSAAAILLPVVTAFPIALGYNSGDFPDRGQFLLDAGIILSLSNAALVTGSLIAGRLDSWCIQKALCIGTSVCAIGLFCVTDPAPLNTVSYQVLHELYHGTYQKYHQECRELFDYLQTREGEDVVLTKEQYPQPIPLYCNFIITEDPSYWINNAVSKYYGLKSLACEPDAVDVP